jgi:Asp-tRNA(Asn)/Glu-tRNA(Gln) amidotransferase A subunit family amidase
MPNATRSYELAALSFLVLAISLYYLKLSVGFYSPTPQHVPSSVDLLSATTADLINGLEDGTFTSFQLISEYQRRIARDNRAGLWLNAMLSTAPEDNVLQIAKQRDDQRKTGLLLGPLHGVPFVVKVVVVIFPCVNLLNLVKDIMVTDRSRGMRTTYGAYALQDSVAPNVAFIVQKAEEAGAIVIGKTNLQVSSSSATNLSRMDLTLSGNGRFQVS